MSSPFPKNDTSKDPKLITGSKEPFFLFTIGWWNNHFHVHIFILRCLRLLSILVFLSRFDLSHKIFHVRTMLYTEGSVQKRIWNREVRYMTFYSHTQNSRCNTLYACDPNVHTNIKRIWVLFNKIHFLDMIKSSQIPE